MVKSFAIFNLKMEKKNGILAQKQLPVTSVYKYQYWAFYIGPNRTVNILCQETEVLFIHVHLFRIH